MEYGNSEVSRVDGDTVLVLISEAAGVIEDLCVYCREIAFVVCASVCSIIL